MRGELTIQPLGATDRREWEILARGYKAFYGTDHSDEEYEAVWRRLIAGAELHGLCARLDAEMVGLAHFLFHPTAWTGEACYLQDLFTAEAARGLGIAGALIDRVAEAAQERGATRLYWLTKQDNARARALYDRIAAFKGFIRYDYPV